MDNLHKQLCSIDKECSRLATKFGIEIFSLSISDPQTILGSIGARCINAVEKFESHEEGWTVQVLRKWTMCIVKDFRCFVDNYEEILLTESSGKQPPFCGCKSCFGISDKQAVQRTASIVMKMEKEETRDQVKSNQQTTSTTRDELHCIDATRPCGSCEQRNVLNPGQKWRTAFHKPLFENEQLPSWRRHKRASQHRRAASMLYMCEDDVKTFRSSSPMKLPNHLVRQQRPQDEEHRWKCGVSEG